MKGYKRFLIGLVATLSFSVAGCVEEPIDESLESQESSSSSAKRSSSRRSSSETSIDPLTLLQFTLNEDGESYSVSSESKLLKDVTIPSTHEGLPVTSIPRGGFYVCSNLTSITMPDSITSIGQAAFQGCMSLREINFSRGITSLGSNTCTGCKSLVTADIPSGVTSIGDYSFRYCESLKSIALPDTLTSIGEEVFSYDRKLESVVIPNNVTSIGKKAFFHCASLVYVVVGESVTSIGEEAFFDCPRLAEVVNKSNLPLEVGSLEYGFVAWSAKEVITDERRSKISFNLLKDFVTYNENAHLWIINYTGDNKDTVTIPNGIEKIGDSCFENNVSLFYDGLRYVNLPEGITYIGRYAFLDCESLNNIVLPSTLTAIGYSAFERCKTFTEIDFPEGLTTIGRRSFSYCDQLRVINLPNTLTSIEEEAFYSDRYLEVINYAGTTEEWAAIEKGNLWWGGAKTVTCTNGSVSTNPPKEDSSSN